MITSHSVSALTLGIDSFVQFDFPKMEENKTEMRITFFHTMIFPTEQGRVMGVKPMELFKKGNGSTLGKGKGKIKSPNDWGKEEWESVKVGSCLFDITI